MDRKARLLIGLAVLWGALLVYRVMTHEPPRTAPLTYPQGATASPAIAKMTDARLRVKAELLEMPRVGVDHPRNIFAPIQVYVPPPPAPPAPPTAPEPPALPPPPPPPSEEELAAQRARAELAQYKYLGYLSRGGRELAYVSRGRDTFTAGRGEPLTGGIIVKDVTPTHIVLLEPQTQIELTVALSGS